MKKLLTMTLALFLMGTTTALAQSQEEIRKERKEMKKLAKSELNEKASKAARKEAKKLKKEGWTNAPGALPIDKQLDKSYMMQMESDEDLFPKYMMGEAMSIGQNYDAAKQELEKKGEEMQKKLDELIGW